MLGALRKEVGEILGKVCKMEEVTIVKAATMPDNVHMYVSIPPKVSISKTIGRIKGKSALMIFDRHPEYREKYKRVHQFVWVSSSLGYTPYPCSA